MMQDNHIFQGMRRDNHPIRQPKQFLWDAHNIRLTTRDDNTLLSITNEKSTKSLLRFNPEECYVGHCVIGNYLTLFTAYDTEDEDRKNINTIYRIEFNTDPIKSIILYKGNLNLKINNPIQAIGDYESELIQKVYWIDGHNRPRVINVSKPELLEIKEETNDYSKIYNDSPFDFIPDLNLNETIEVKRLLSGNGIFPAGVIQYAFTYYNKYGQESNIFNTTEQLYISYNDRGGSPEDNISTAFKIHIENTQNNFDYLRIYSIIRTSIDAVPTVKRVADIELKSKPTSIDYIDDGTSGDIVDPTMLLYIGGKDIVAHCIAAKDNTLFLGNIEYNRREITSLETSKGTKLSKAIENIGILLGTRDIILTTNKDSSNIYKYNNQLSQNTSTFKIGDYYRLGLQFQYKNGEWSEPVYAGTIPMTGSRPNIDNNKLILPIFKTNLSSDIIAALSINDYKKVRPVIVLPSINDRQVLAQGIICPTVFSLGNRLSNSPFTQSSWLLRPFCIDDPTTSNGNYTATKGSIAEFRHLNPLLSGFNRGAEIQNMFLDEKALSSNSDIHDYSLDAINLQDASYNSIWYVDQSILTFHSPDIEFDDAVQLGIEGDTFEIDLVGVVPFSSNCGDIDVQVSSPVINPDASGFIHRSIINSNIGSRSLISGLFYEDSWVEDGKNSNDLYRDGVIRPWMTYLWHRSGSLNNDCVRPDGKSTQSALLKKKIISNIKISKNIKWLKDSNIIRLDTSELQLFDSNEISLLKIKDSNSNVGDITYYGNVDSMNPSYSKFRLVMGEGEAKILMPNTAVFSGYIIINNASGQSKIYFHSLKVENIVGSKDTGTIRGGITSDTIIKVPVQIEDPETGDISYETTDINLNGGVFDATIKDKLYAGSITKDGNLYLIEGSTAFTINYISTLGLQASFNFEAGLLSVDPSPNYIGNYLEALKLSKDAVRIKYKSTPHVLFATNYNNATNTRDPLPIIEGTSTKSINFGDGEGQLSKLPWLNKKGSIYQKIVPLDSFSDPNCPESYLWLAEIRRKRENLDTEKLFGGKTPEALRNNLWIPAGPAVKLSKTIEWCWGDTWFQRYDCLKTYPFTPEDINQVVEIGSFLCETRVNIDGRYDRNRGAISNLNMTPLKFNKINPVYSQRNSFFNYRILDSDYYKVKSYPSQILWTGVKSTSANQDSWTNLHMTNSLDLDGINGKVISIQPFNDLLTGFQEKAVSQILFNSRVQIQATDGVPIEISNSQKVEGARPYSNSIGCQDKSSIVTTPMGIYFMDNNNHNLYRFDGQINNISLQLGTMYWARENYWDTSWTYKRQNKINNGVRLSYDPKHQDVYFVPGPDDNNREALCYSEQLGQFTSLLSYGGAVMFPHKSKFYSIAPDENNIMNLWENFPSDSNDYNTIFGVKRDYGFSFISNDNPAVTKIFDTIEMRADCYDPAQYNDNNFEPLGKDLTHNNQSGKPFNYIQVENEYQRTGDRELKDSNMRKKFRVWRCLIPRKENSRERIRNPWAKITLKMVNPSNELTILHDLNVGYTI